MGDLFTHAPLSEVVHEAKPTFLWPEKPFFKKYLRQGSVRLRSDDNCNI
ncbi:hypothetical protein [Pseudomonas viridiflava]|nr:hypothetical protein [Pseudomonas viridiflava]